MTRRFTYYLSHGERPDAAAALEVAEQLRLRGLGIVFKINDRAQRAVGMVSLAAFEDPAVGELAAIVARESRGRGFGGRATALLADWAVRERRMRRLEAHVDPDNEKALKLLVRLGFQEEGVRRSYEGEGPDGDRKLLSLLRGELELDSPYLRLSRQLGELHARAGEPGIRQEIVKVSERCIGELCRRLSKILTDAGFNERDARLVVDRSRTVPLQLAEHELARPLAHARSAEHLGAQLMGAWELYQHALEWQRDEGRSGSSPRGRS